MKKSYSQPLYFSFLSKKMRTIHICCLMFLFCLSAGMNTTIKTNYTVGVQTEDVQCMAKCLQCPEDPNICKKCEPDTFLQDKVCLSCGQNCISCQNDTICEICASGFYIDDTSGKCKVCILNCLNCTQNSSCQQCIPGYYFEIKNKSCSKCMTLCVQCINSSSCNKCENTYFFANTSCQKCNKIYANCITCETIQKFTSIVYSSEVVCKVCNNKFYLDSNNTCQSCMTNCIICRDGQSCVQCKSPYIVNESSQCQLCTIALCTYCMNLTSCYICQTGYYFDPAISKTTCLNCSNGCEQCDRFSCGLCLKGYYLKNGNCYKCDSSCQYCYNSPSNCSQCFAGYFKVSFDRGTCAKCPQPCVECKNVTQCTRCLTGSYLSKGICTQCSLENCDICNLTTNSLNHQKYTYKQEQYQLPQLSQKCYRCVIGYYLKDQQCEKCIQGCQKCTDSLNCSSCFVGYYFNSQKTQCYKCQGNCASCSDTNQTLQCLTCFQGFRKDVANQKCIPCTSNCRFCQSDENFCMDCKDGYYREGNSTNLYCIKCVEPCKTCWNKTGCLDCAIGYYMNSRSQCIKCQQGCEQCNEYDCFKCGMGYRLEFANMTCQKCKVDKCSKCQKSQEKCVSCEDGYKYFEPTNNTEDPSLTSMCYNCFQEIEGCKSCESPFVCNECINGLVLGDGLTSVCQKESNFLEFLIIVGALSFVILVLIGVICILKIKRKRQEEKLKTETQNLIQQDNFSINSEEVIETEGKSVLSTLSSTDRRI